MKNNEQVQEVPLSEINLDRETQIRAEMSEETVQRYFDVMEDEAALAKFPPIILYRDEAGKLWIADGHHRIAAALRRGFTKIHAIIIDGSKSEAIWAAVKANGRNGLQMSKTDIRRAVEMLHSVSPESSNVMIAEAIGCNEGTVRRYRKTISGSARAEPEKRVGKDGKLYPAKRQKKETEGETENEQQNSSPAEEWQFEEGYPPLSQPIPEKDSQFVQTVKLQNIPLNDPERLIACLFDLFSAEYREKLVHDLMAMMRTDDGEATTRRIMKKLNKNFPSTNSDEPVTVKLKSSLKVNEKYCCGVKFEPDPNDDYFDWITDEERAELREMQKTSPNRVIPQIHSITIQSIPEHKPDHLITCLFSQFKPLYRRKLLKELLHEMHEVDGKESVENIVQDFHHEHGVKGHAPNDTHECNPVIETTNDTATDQKTELKPISRSRPDLLVKNLLDDFPKEFVPDMAREIFQKLHDRYGEDVTDPLATEIYEKYGRESD